jgi:hypothetical protein
MSRRSASVPVHFSSIVRQEGLGCVYVNRQVEGGRGRRYEGGGKGRERWVAAIEAEEHI